MTSGTSQWRAQNDPLFSMTLPMPDRSLLKACWKGASDGTWRHGDEPGAKFLAFTDCSAG
jgi:hypothetical protein